MVSTQKHLALQALKPRFQGDIFTDDTMCLLYATDASAYREKPLAVVRPKNKEDIRLLIQFANEHKTLLEIGLFSESLQKNTLQTLIFYKN